MDDDQLVNEQAATLADESKESAAEVKKPEGEEANAKTETEHTDGDAKDAGDTASDDAKPDEDKEDEPKKKKLSGIERLKRRLETAEAALRSRSTDGEVSASDVERLIGKPPREEDFKGDYLAYERELTAYALDKRQAEREIRSQGERAKAAHAERMRDLVEEHQERVEEFRGKVKDFDAVMQSAAHLRVAPIVEELVIESDKSAHLQFYLAKNPQTLARLNDMSERDAAREIGRIEQKLSLPTPKTKTSAPKPVTPPKGGASPKPDPTKMSTAEYVKWRQAGNG